MSTGAVQAQAGDPVAQMMQLGLGVMVVSALRATVKCDVADRLAAGAKTADALASVYGSETDKNVKSQIMRSLASQGAGKQLVEVVRNEKDAELKTSGVRMLGQVRGSKEASPTNSTACGLCLCEAANWRKSRIA